MSQILVRHGFQQAKKLLLIQTLIIVLISAFGLLKELMVAVALLSGGIVILIANTYFVFKAFSKSGAQANKQVVRAFYFGETVKIALSISLLIVAFLLLPGFEMYVLVGYIMALLCQWLTPVIIKTH
ncbi:ATP synthase subunit I [Aliikangiella maris]|uniref:ATP synthase subunit I n=2 Tax=Aliikangiella maris TaxID=3162458 RepID=A0ABV2BX50_9GAMM